MSEIKLEEIAKRLDAAPARDFDYSYERRKYHSQDGSKYTTEQIEYIIKFPDKWFVKIGRGISADATGKVYFEDCAILVTTPRTETEGVSRFTFDLNNAGNRIREIYETVHRRVSSLDASEKKFFEAILTDAK